MADYEALGREIRDAYTNQKLSFTYPTLCRRWDEWLTADRARTLSEAADAWEDDSPENLDRLRAMADEHYQPGGPSMPAIWLRLRAAAVVSDAATEGHGSHPLRYEVGDVVRYVGDDPRWVGQSGPVTEADYSRRVALVVELPNGPKGVGICFEPGHVELAGAAPVVSDAATEDACSTPGCKGDYRYSAPGRGHLTGCTYPLAATEGGESGE